MGHRVSAGGALHSGHSSGWAMSISTINRPDVGVTCFLFCRMSSPRVVFAICAVLVASALPARAAYNAVVQWQDAVEQVVRTYNISNQISAKFYALTNIAQYQVGSLYNARNAYP